METPEEKRKRLNREKARRHYERNKEKCREQSRNSARKRREIPEERAKINVRKRGGGKHKLSIEELEKIFASQNYQCAICKTTEPEGKTGVNGWNIDHCHSSNKVRFILCASCNKGLGAFKDNMASLRKAADLLEDFYNDHQSKSFT